MTTILAVDPGTHRSGWVQLARGGRMLRHGTWANADLRDELRLLAVASPPTVVIERIDPRYGRGIDVGMEVIATAVWIGRLIEAARPSPVRLLRRSAILTHLGVAARGGSADSGVRAALIDRYGGREAAIGRKAAPGPLHGIVGHEWQALAVAVTFADAPALAEEVG